MARRCCEPGPRRARRRGTRFSQAYAAPTCAEPLLAAHRPAAATPACSPNTHGPQALRAEDVTVAEVLGEPAAPPRSRGQSGASVPTAPAQPGTPTDGASTTSSATSPTGTPTTTGRRTSGATVARSGSRRTPARTRPSRDLITVTRCVSSTGSTPKPFFLDVSYTTHAPNEIPDPTPYAERMAGGRAQPRLGHLDRHPGRPAAAAARGPRSRPEHLVMVVSDNATPHGEGAHYDHVGSHLPPRWSSSTATARCRAGSARCTRSESHPDDRQDPGHPANRGLPRAGRRRPHPGRGVGPAPTFAHLAGAQVPRGLGISFVATLRGRRQRRHSHFYWQHRGEHFEEAVRFRALEGGALAGGGSGSFASARTSASGTTSPDGTPRRR